MLRGRGWFGGGLWKPKNPHSLEHLRYLYAVLSKNQTVQESNRSLLVETLRSIAEILIWGDQNDSSVFDFFLEKNMLSFFLKIMKQKCGSYVCVQLLQTLNILFENIRNETSLYYLLSNNHVNSIIVHKFDFSDEEVMAYYISFLKTLSFKLNTHTIHFFYNEHTNDFPLYTEAIKFFNHPESMVRIAVRTLTLNVYRVNDQSMLQFINDKTAAPYFSNLVWFIGNHILELETCVRSDVDHNSRNRLADLVAEHLDHLHYINDILKLGISSLNQVLADHLLNRLLVPLLIYSLVPQQHKDERPRISSVVSLFLLAQVFIIITYVPLLKALAKIVFHGDNSLFADDNTFMRGCDGSLVRRAFVAPEEPLDKALQSKCSTNNSQGSASPQQTQGSPSQVSPVGAGPMVAWSSESVNVVEEGAAQVEGSGNASFQPTDHEAQEAALCNELSVSSPAAEIPTNIGSISSIEASHINITDEEKQQLREQDFSESFVLSSGLQDLSLSSRPYLSSVFSALDCTDNDYYALFGLSLLYAIGHNQESNLENNQSSENSYGENKVFYNTQLVDKMLETITHSCQYNSKVRVATLEMTLLVLKQCTGMTARSNSSNRRGSGGQTSATCHSSLRDHHLATLEGAREEATLMLRNFYKSEEIFLDMFEDEWHEMHRKPLNVEYLLQDASILLPPAGTPLTGIEFSKRLPCGEVERARRAMRVFFLVRQMSLEVRDEPDTHLPLTNPAACVQVSDVLDLNNSDLIACVVITRDGQRTRRFLVIDVIQLILVEPDTKRLGWGVAKFVGFLQDLEVSGDKDDSRVLHLTIHRPSAASGAVGRPTTPVLAAKFIFDDHIRCMAAKQRLSKGRLKARQRKLHQIARLLDLPGHLQPCPSPPAHALHTMRQEAHRRGLSRLGDSRSRSSQAHRPLFTVNRVPGFALKREGIEPVGTTEESQNPVYSRSESESPSRGGGSSPSRGGGSQAMRQQVITTRSRNSRSSSRPRPRPRSGEDIPLEDMNSADRNNSTPTPKVNSGQSEKRGSSSSSSSNSEAPDTTDGLTKQMNVGSHKMQGSPQCVSLVGSPNPVSGGNTRLLPALQGLTPIPIGPNMNLSKPVVAVDIKTVTSIQGDSLFPEDDVATPTPSPHTPTTSSQIPTYPEKETSFTKPPLTRTLAAAPGFDVFEPQSNGLRERTESSQQNSTGSADFSPLRKVRVKGNIETV